jgi:recombinase
MRISRLRKVFIVDDEPTMDGLAVHSMSIVPFQILAIDSARFLNADRRNLAEDAPPSALLTANPRHAGAFVYGRHRAVPSGKKTLGKRMLKVNREKWQVLIPNAHPGYIFWEEFEHIEVTLRPLDPPDASSDARP